MKQKNKQTNPLRFFDLIEKMNILVIKFLGYLKDNGIVSQQTPFETPQLNGISERRNRTLLDMVRSMMSFNYLSLYLWRYILLTVIHLLNRIPSKTIPTTPYEIWYSKKSSLDYLKTWRCPTYVKKYMMINQRIDL